jgi:tripartite-type tricarboxylate transporter receptor subunit TctC
MDLRRVAGYRVITVALFFFLLPVWGVLRVPAALGQGKPFYQGKTMRIVVGFTPGGFYDRWARLVGRHLSNHIPGNPDIIVQNMPGAGSAISANYVYAVAKPDGLTLGMPGASVYMEQVVGRRETQFDWKKFNFIGTQDKRHQVLYMRTDAPYKSIDDVIKADKPPKCGATGTASQGYMTLKILEDAVGAKFKHVMGYPGGSEVDVAVERGEVICRAMSIDPFFGREPFRTWRKRKFIRLIVQTGKKRDARAPDVVTIHELMDKYKSSEKSRRVVRVILGASEFGSPVIAPPGTPADRVKILRRAHAMAMKDPKLIAEAKRGKLVMAPSTGEELQALAREVIVQPPEVLARVKAILKR